MNTQNNERYTARRFELKYARNLQSNLKHLDLKKNCCVFVCDDIGLLSESEPKKKERKKYLISNRSNQSTTLN